MAFGHNNRTENGLKAQLVAFLALLFVSAQFLATAHTAAYGDADHVHDGHPCIVASIVKKSSDMDVAPAPVLDVADQREWFAPTLPSHAPHSLATTTRPIRGPPAHA
ncbi:MAG: hypothetical protein HWE25_01335 [Alphaproteobacteria bacterium]|nr:hypothetical protein [Alphaproteobacteria bacterium]